MHTTIQDYLDSKPIPFPILREGKIILESYTPLCAGCNDPTTEIRGEVISHTYCDEAHVAGRCRKCMIVTWCRSRFYDTHILHWTSDGITTIPLKSKGILQKIALKIQKLWKTHHQ